MNQVRIHEVGLRDGLQMETRVVPLDTKIRWTRELIRSGVPVIQLGSFVHPRRVPQMADTDLLFRHFSGKHHPAVFSGLILNSKGLERALDCGVDLICTGVSASETHSRKNTGTSQQEALEITLEMARQALAAGRQVQVSVQSAFGCGYEGAVPESAVLEIVARYRSAGLGSISLADTAGHADPRSVGRLVAAVLKLDSTLECSCHFHDTYAMGLANCMAALDNGVSNFESSFGGLGGCPFTAVAGGNVCSEDLIHMLQRMGLCRELQLEPILRTASEAAAFLGRTLPGKIYQSGPIPTRNGGEKTP